MRKCVVALSFLVSCICQGAEFGEPQEKKAKIVDEEKIFELLYSARYDIPQLLALVAQYPLLCANRIDHSSSVIEYVVSGMHRLSKSTFSLPLFLKAGVPINQKNKHGRTALMEAAYYDSLNRAKLLLEHKARIDPLDDDGADALTHAFCYDSGGAVVEVMMKHASFSSLVNRSVVTGYNSQGSIKKSYLQQALEKSDHWYLDRNCIVENLLKAGAHVDQQALFEAAQHEELFDLLLPYCSLRTLQTCRENIASQYRGPSYIDIQSLKKTLGEAVALRKEQNMDSKSCFLVPLKVILQIN